MIDSYTIHFRCNCLAFPLFQDTVERRLSELIGTRDSFGVLDERHPDKRCSTVYLLLKMC